MLLNNIFSYLYKKRNEETDTIKKTAYENVINHLTSCIRDDRCNLYSVEQIRGNLISKMGYCSYLKQVYKKNSDVFRFHTEVINICDFCLSNLS